jgi:hypothetical protein
MDGEQTQLLRGWLLRLSGHRSAGELLQIRSYRNTGQTEGLDPVLEIGSYTQLGIVSQRSQLEPKRQDGLHIATRANRGEQHFHCHDHVTGGGGRFSGFCAGAAVFPATGMAANIRVRWETKEKQSAPGD